MRDLFKSFFDTYTERLKNPLLGSFSISFVLFNWRPLLILLFSDANIECKIEIINDKYCYIGAILWPLGIALVYIIVLPYCQLIIEFFLTYFKFKKKNLKNKIIDDNMEIRIKQAEYERKIADKRAGTSEINELQTRLNASSLDYEIRLKQLSDVIDKSSVELKDLEVRNISNIEYGKRIQKELDKSISLQKKFELINSLLIDYSSTNSIDIKRYLKASLSNGEIKTLKIDLKSSINILQSSEFSKENLALMYKAKILRMDQDEFLSLTDTGIAFISEL